MCRLCENVATTGNRETPVEYAIIFTKDQNGDEVNVVDTFVSWFDADSETVTKVSDDMWFIEPGKGFKRDLNDDGVALITQGIDNAGLHQILAAFFRFSAQEKAYAAVMDQSPDAPSKVVLISNDPAVEPDPQGDSNSGLMRSYQTAAVLGSADLFGRLSGQMFGRPTEDPEEEASDDDSEDVTTGLGPWIFGSVAGAIDDAEETIALIGGENITAEHVLANVLQLPSYQIAAGDYFSFEDRNTGSIVVAQPFPTHAGDYVELRLTMPPSLSQDDIFSQLYVAAHSAGLDQILRVVEYDDIEGTVQSLPLLADGTTGPMRSLNFDG